MRPLTIKLGIQATDASIYAGQLFLALSDGNVGYLSMNKLLLKIANGDRSLRDGLLKLAFARNEWLTNEEGLAYFRVDGLRQSFDQAWADQANMPLELDIDNDDIVMLSPIKDDAPVLDMKAYAMRLYVSTTKGVHESRLQPDHHGRRIEPTRMQKVFDGNGMALSAYGGEVLVSSGRDGLFHGPIHDPSKHIRIGGTRVQDVSYRCGWSNYDLLNYVDQSRFDYLVNETAKEERKFPRSVSEHESKKITKLGARVLSGNEMDRRKELSMDTVLYAFNSSSHAFMYQKDGTLTISSIVATGGPHLEEVTTVPILENEPVQRPLSHALVAKGCVLEFFDKVCICQNREVSILQEGAMFSTRGYSNSRRYSNLVTTVGEDCVSIFSIYPSVESGLPRGKSGGVRYR